ncbi:hypothetical protein GF420_07015, partial [candidate division GN15 bacterium]|nr:hypothetical protein [candidate division GN15 bacterium]
DNDDGVSDLIERSNQHGLDLTVVNLAEEPDQEPATLEWTDHDRSRYPILRMGGDKIRAIFFNARGAVLNRLVGEVHDHRAAPDTTITVYSTPTCGSCRALEQWLRTMGESFNRVDITEVDGMADKLIQWSGGRRVVPTIEFADTARLFNPGLPLISRYIGKR